MHQEEQKEIKGIKTKMPKPEGLFLLEGISILKFNKDFTQCALSKKDNLIYIYQVVDFNNPEKWTLLHTLKNHFQYISGIDWCPETNKIASCSYDKTLIIWTFTGDKWKGETVVNTVKIGYLCCAWNKRGDKLATGTSGKQVAITYFSKQSNWWVARSLKINKSSIHKSSVSCVAINPSSTLLISGGTDLKIIVSSIYDPDIDDAFLTPEQKKDVKDFGTELYTFQVESWITSVAWTLEDTLALYCSQSSNLGVVDWKAGKTDQIPLNHSPLSFILPVSGESFYGVGFDRNIYHYSKESSGWVLKKLVTKSEKKEVKPKTTSQSYSGGVAERLKAFEGQGMKKKESLVVASDRNEALHYAPISSIAIKEDQIITTDLAGFVKYWKI